MNLAALSERFPVRSFATAGGAVSYRQADGLAPVVLLHGIGSGSASWVRQLSDLPPTCSVLAWDAPGYGGSDPLAAPQPSAHDYATRVWQWLDMRLPGQAPVTLVGHSLGALMATAAAVQQPTRVARLLLLAPAQGYGKAQPELRASKRDDRLHALRTLGPAGMAEKRASAMLSEAATPEQLAYVQSIMAQVHPAGYEQATHMLAGADLFELLQAVSCPVTIASGAADRITTADACQGLARRAGLPYVSLGAVGHACALEAADAVCRLILENTRP